MNIKLTILNGYFFLSLIGTILIKTVYTSIIPISKTYLYSFFVTIPFFILQFLSLYFFSRKVKKGNPTIFKEACKRPNGSIGSSINVAALFDEKIPFKNIKNKSLIQELAYVKRVVVFSLLSFLALIVLYFV